MKFSRRDFFGIAGGVGLVAATASLSALNLGPTSSTGEFLPSEVPLPERFSRPLQVPGVAVPAAVPVAGADMYRLVQRAGTADIIRGLPTPIWGYDGTFPGPTIRARSGRPVTVAVRNELAVPSVVHLHGGRTPADSDGYPTDLILPTDEAENWRSSRAVRQEAIGERTYRYPLEQRAATLWYHDHTMDFTGPNVYRGLAGFFLIGDAEEDGLPLPGGDRDLPLMICDRAFAADGSFRYPALSGDQQVPGVQGAFMGGVLGDVVLVNGTAWPTCEVDAARYRLRVLNASNARRFQLALDPPPPTGKPFVQIGTDGGLLTEPVARSSVTLASAERADLIVDFGAYPVGTVVTMRNLLGTGSTADVLQFRVVRAVRDDSSVPAVLSAVETLDPADAVTTRTFAFQLRRASMLTHSAGGHQGHDGSGLESLMWTINGAVFDPEVDLATPRLGDVEIWRLMTDLHHPVHIHLAPFQVLRRGGRSPGPNDLGWKDTIDLTPGETAEIIIRFDGYPGRYVFHCHNLEHEDMAMMANFTVRGR
ncbi:multicopper oxidase family protein [Nakamurella sp. GG22]